MSRSRSSSYHPTVKPCWVLVYSALIDCGSNFQVILLRRWLLISLGLTSFLLVGLSYGTQLHHGGSWLFRIAQLVGYSLYLFLFFSLFYVLYFSFFLVFVHLYCNLFTLLIKFRPPSWGYCCFPKKRFLMMNRAPPLNEIRACKKMMNRAQKQIRAS